MQIFVIVRELTGGIYFGEREEAQGEGANEFAWDKETYSRYEVERIMDIAMETARKRNKKVVSVDKANVLASSRLWRKIAQEKAAANPDIATDYFYVDNTAMQLVVNPAQFDVIVTTNLFGDILSDEANTFALSTDTTFLLRLRAVSIAMSIMRSTS